MQAAHATLEAGLKAGQSSSFKETSTLILLEAKSEDHLLAAHEHLTQNGIACALFYEPDDHLGYPPGYTSLATHPLTAEHRHHFKNFKLYRPRSHK